MFCEVYLFDVPYHIDRPFDYSCGENVRAGDIVRVPFGKADSLRIGAVSSVKSECGAENIKPVHSILSDISLTEEMLGLCLFLKEYTLCTFGEAVRSILPPGMLGGALNVKYRRVFSLAVEKEDAAAVLSANGRAGIRSQGQRLALERLIALGEIDEQIMRAEPNITSAHLRALAERGLIRIASEEVVRNPYSDLAKNKSTEPIVLSRAQNAAYAEIERLYEERKARCALLFGVTGSGKTKVIMKAIDKTLADDKNVIMLVPEIALTPQTVGLFCRRYGERVAVIHSSLSQGERQDTYRRIAGGDVDLVIGTRSAIFAPLSDIGLIVIDEEHEHTYKSESDPKYHARDVASYRAGVHNALVILASATPSLESYYKAERGIYTLIPLMERYGGFSLPRAVIVDMREELRRGNTTPLSERLYNELDAVRERDEQAIIFLNRRGYSSQISCKECGEVISCPRCSVSLTYHSGSSGGKLLCHLCGYTEPTPRACPSCSSDRLSFLGFGTQKLEGEMGKYLPDMKVMRMDADTTTQKFAYDKMLDDFRAGKADILLGTQMVAKGHDFPRVTAVGVALADTSLFISDFRASERTFSLLTQVIGRAGRAKENGTAVIQTYAPKNEVIRLACKQDYVSFYKSEIAVRSELSYPPFCDMAQLTLTSSDEAELNASAVELSALIKEKLTGKYSELPFIVFGPFEAQIYKLNEKFRLRMVLKCRLKKEVREFFHELLLEFSKNRKVTLSVDLNPLTV